MRDFITLGSAPIDEPCVQVTDKGDYHDEMRKECRRYLELLEKTFPNIPNGACFRIMSFPHDFGSYYEVAISYDVDDEDAVDFAISVENNLPDTW